MDDSNNIHYLVGKIVMNFVNTEFIISDISYKLNITENNLEFLADSRTAIKINKLIKKFKKSNIENKEDYILLLKDFDDVRIQRNQIVHSLILKENETDDNKYISLHYKKINERITSKDSNLISSDFENINKSITKIRNCFGRTYTQNRIR